MEDHGWEITEYELDGRHVTVCRRHKEDLPLVVMNSVYADCNDMLHSVIKHNSPAFQLVNVSGLEWDEMLSPWPSDPVVTKNDHFTGHAREYSQWMDDKLLPFAEEKLPKVRERVLAGYSMGGLFAVYAPYVSASWDRSVCGSGSVWFPGFMKFALETPFVKKPLSVYFSIGNKETESRTHELTTTRDIMEALGTYYKGEGIDSILEINQGNHFTDVPSRMAKGIAWTVREK